MDKPIKLVLKCVYLLIGMAVFSIKAMVEPMGTLCLQRVRSAVVVHLPMLYIMVLLLFLPMQDITPHKIQCLV
ncbi:hypothetical protein D3C80_1615760 [compost metagenome]